MADREIILTPEGFQRLKEEIEYLSSVKRDEVAERIRAARDFGDISENSEYDDAKNEQAMLEARIYALEERLRSAIVIDSDSVTTDKVGVGTKVTVQDMKAGDIVQYAIVGSAVRRFRPIVLTAAAAVLALIPLSTSIFWGPMALAMMGGLVAGTVLTLTFLPALLSLLTRNQPPTERPSADNAQSTLGREEPR